MFLPILAFQRKHDKLENQVLFRHAVIYKDFK